MTPWHHVCNLRFALWPQQPWLSKHISQPNFQSRTLWNRTKWPSFWASLNSWINLFLFDITIAKGKRARVLTGAFSALSVGATVAGVAAGAALPHKNGSGGILVRQRSQYVHVLQLPGCGMSTSPWENKIDTFYDATALHERRQCSIHDFQNQVPSRSTATCHSKSCIPLSPLLARLSWRFWSSLAIYRN